MNIIIAINDAYIEPAKTMLYSLAKNNPSNITVYLLHKCLTQTVLDDLRVFLKRDCQSELISIQIDSILFADAPTQKWWSEETYYRLLAFDVLPAKCDRALWLDADIIVNGNIEAFYYQSFEEQYAVVCKGCNQRLKYDLGLPQEHEYFNAGVILFNLQRIRANFTKQSIFDCLREYNGRLNALDQDVLNLLFSGHVLYVDEQIYNCEVFGFHVYSKEKMDGFSKARIIHFAGPLKPWKRKGANWADRFWWKYELARGRYSAYLIYRLQNAPWKFYHIFRECFYMLIAMCRKVTR